MSASRRRTPPARHRRRTVSCRSRTGRRAIPTSRPKRSSARTRWRWCASACGPRTIRASSTRSRSSTRNCAATCRKDLSGTAIPATAMASTPTARPSTAPARAGRGRCWPANAPITNWRRAPGQGGKPAQDVRGLGRASAACCRSRSGTAPTCRSANCGCGGPSGSAMPLVWAHSEHIKLLRSLRDGAVFDMPPQGVKRYIEGKTSLAAQDMALQQQDPHHARRQDAARRAARRPAWSTGPATNG